MPDMNDFNQKVIDEFRASEGRVGGMFEGAPMVLLTHRGAKSGTERTTPLMSRVSGDGTIYIFASKAGAPTNPDWFHNIVAHPQVGVEFGTDSFTATAEALTGTERAEVFAAQAAEWPQFAEYQQKTDREIPVVALHRG